MQFDVILTNPPFQDSVNRKKTPHKLWIDFTLSVFDRFLREGGNLVQVSPASFSSPSNVVLKLMGENETRRLRFDINHHFPDVGSTFSDYWVVKRSDGQTATRVEVAADTFDIKLDESTSYLPSDISRLSMSIHRKVMFTQRDKLPVEWDYVTCHNIRRRDPSPSLAETPSAKYRYPVFHTNNVTWYSSIRQDWAGLPKVMWTRSGYTKPFYDDGIYGGTDMAYFVRVSNAEEGRTLAANLNLELMRYIYRTARWSGFGNERVFSNLPNLPRDARLDDQELFALFALESEEIDYVRAALVPRRSKAL